MHKGDIARSVGKSFGTVGNALGSSKKFSRVDVDEYGLRQWGGTIYDSVASRIKQAIRERGGMASADEVVADVTNRFSVSPKSVRAYLGTHEFVRVGRGTYRIRGASEKPALATRAKIEDTQSCFKIESLWSLRIDHDADRARGSGAGIPWAFAYHVGLMPGARFEAEVVHGRGPQALGDLLLSWPKNVPTLGSVAAIAGELHLTIGDYLFLSWDPSSKRFKAYATKAVTRSRVDEPTTRSAIASLVGISPTPKTTGAVLRQLAEALGLEPESGRGPVLGRLRTRRDSELTTLSRTLYDLQALRADTESRE